MHSLILGVAILIAFYLVSSRVSVHYKLPEGYEAAGPGLEDLERRLGKTFNTVAARGDLFAMALIVVWCLEVWLTSHVAAQNSADPGAFFVFRPDAGVWVFSAIVGAFGISTLATRLWTMRALGEHAEAYERYCNLKNNFQGEPVCKVLAATYITLSLLMIALASDCHAAVKNTGITVNPMMSFGARQRSWSEVDRLIHAKAIALPGGIQFERSIWQIRFKDGTLWSSDYGPCSHSERDTFLFMTYATIQSGVPLEEVALLQDADR